MPNGEEQQEQPQGGGAGKQIASKLAKKVGGKVLATLAPWLSGACITVAIVLALVFGLSAMLFFVAPEGSVATTTPTTTLSGVLDVPYMNQFRDDPNNCRGGSHWEHTGSVGCGITSLAMVARYYHPERIEITPDWVYDQIGISYNYLYLNKLIADKGVQYTRVSINNDAQAEDALKKVAESIQKGNPGVVHILPPFAHSKHIMVITGFDSSGNVYINDPNCGRGTPPYLKLGAPAGKNNLAPRAEFKKAIYSGGTDGGRAIEYVP